MHTEVVPEFLKLFLFSLRWLVTCMDPLVASKMSPGCIPVVMYYLPLT